MSKLNFTKITNIATGAVMSDGTMQTNLDTIGVTKEGTASVNFAEPETTYVYGEETDTAVAAIEGSAERSVVIESLIIEASVLAGLIGATYTAGGGGNPENLKMPASAAQQLRALQFSALNTDNEPVIVKFPKVKVSYSIPGTVGKKDARGWQLTFTILQPDDGAGNLTPWMDIDVGPDVA